MPDFPPFQVHYGALVGQYRTTWRAAIVATQAANSRLFSLRNKGTNLIIPIQLTLKLLQTGAHTAAIEDSLDVFKLTAFSASDNTNAVAPTATVKITTMPAAPGNVEIFGVTAAGAAAGMTGGTLTKIATPFCQLPIWFLAAMPTGAQVLDVRVDPFIEMGQNAGPFEFANNEGFEVENRVLLGAAAGASLYVDFSYAEVEPF